MKTTRLAAGMMLCGALLSLGALAQYPSRPIKLVVAIAPGGAPDVIARTFAERLGPLVGQAVVVENHTGANGNIAMELVAKSAPDGYTLLAGQDSLIVVNPHMYRKMPIDPLKDLVAVSSTAVSSTFLLVVHPSVPAKDFQQFIEYAKGARPPLAYSSGGNGSLHHLAMEMLKSRAGINLLHVPYKGGALALTAVVSGEVQAAVTSTVAATQVRAGRLRAIAVTGSGRSPIFPELPAVAESYPGYQVFSWFGVFSPAGLPDAVTARLRADFGRVLEMAEVRQRLQAAGQFEPYVTTPEEFASRIRTDYEKFGRLVRDVAIKVD